METENTNRNRYPMCDAAMSQDYCSRCGWGLTPSTYQSSGIKPNSEDSTAKPKIRIEKPPASGSWVKYLHAD